MKLSISLILTVSLAGLQFIAITIVLTSSYLTSERTLLGHARDLLSDVAENTVEHSRGFLRPGKAASDLVTRLAENKIISSDNRLLLEKLLFQQLLLTPQFSGIFYGNDAGEFVYVMRSDGVGPYRTKIISETNAGRETQLTWREADFSIVDTRPDPDDTFDPRDRPWYRSASNQPEGAWTEPYVFFTSRKPGITVSSRILDPSGEVTGVIGVDIEISSISEFLAGLEVGAEGVALIINQNGDVIAHPDLSLVVTPTGDGTYGFNSILEVDDPIAVAAFKRLSQDGGISVTENVTAEFRHGGARYLAVMTPQMSSILPWTIMVVAPEDDFTGDIKLNRTMNAGIALLITVLTGIIGLKIAGSISRPVKMLAARATQISQGDYQEGAPMPLPFRELKQASETMTVEAERRQRLENQYSLLFDRSLRGMAEVSPETGHFHRVNPRFSEILGYSGDELINRPVKDVLGPEIGAPFGRVCDAEPARPIVQIERKCRRKDGDTIWLSVNSLVLSEDTDTPLHAVLVIDDITRAKTAEAQIRQLSLDLTHNARIDMMGQLAAGLAHELNQPLTAITQNAESALIEAQDEKDPELVQILTEIDQQAYRAAEIIRALRGFLRKDEGDKTEFALSDLIEQAVGLVAAEAREKSVVVDLEHGDIKPFTGSRVQIAQVLVNLMRNAIEAMVSVPPSERQIVVTTREDQGFIEVAVSDTGPGVDAEINLFERFESTKPTGMGLGLSICRTIVEQHGGELWCDHDAPGGRFVFSVPRRLPNG